MSVITVGAESRTATEQNHEHHGSGRTVLLLPGWPLISQSSRQLPALPGAHAVEIDGPEVLCVTHADELNMALPAFVERSVRVGAGSSGSA